MQAGEGLFARVCAHSLTRPVLLVGTVTVMVKGIAAAKDIALAGIFGRGDELEVFLIALLLPATLASIIADAFALAIATPLTRLLRTDGVQRREARLKERLGSRKIPERVAEAQRGIRGDECSERGPHRIHLEVRGGAAVGG